MMTRRKPIKGIRAVRHKQPKLGCSCNIWKRALEMRIIQTTQAGFGIRAKVGECEKAVLLYFCPFCGKKLVLN
jgi:hypothetical protein